MPTTATASTTDAIRLSTNVNPRRRKRSILGEWRSNGVVPKDVGDDFLRRRVVLPGVPAVGDERVLIGLLDRVQLVHRVLRHLREVGPELVRRRRGGAGGAKFVRVERHLLNEVATRSGRDVLVLGLVDDDLRAEVTE